MASDVAASAAATMQRAKQKRSGVRGPATSGGVQGKPAVMTKPAIRMPGMTPPAPGQAVSGVPGGPMPPGARMMTDKPLPPGAAIGPEAPGGVSGANVGPEAPGAMSKSMPPGGPDLMSLLPPKMQAAMAQNGRDPREAIGTRMQNDPIFKQKMIAMQGGFPGGPPSGPISMPFQPPGMGGGDAMSMGPGQGGPQGPAGPIPPGAEVGSQMDPGFGAAGQAGMDKLGLGGQPSPPGGYGGAPDVRGQSPGFGGMNPQQLRQMLPPAMQGGLQGGGMQGPQGQAIQGAMQAYQGNPQGLNLQSIQQQMQGGGPAPGGMGGGNPYRGM